MSGQPKIKLLLQTLLMVSTLIPESTLRGASAGSAATNAVSVAETNAAPIPTTEIAAQAESTLSSLRHLELMTRSWQLTSQAQKPSAVPKELLDRVAALQTEISKAHERVSQAFAEALTMQNRLTEHETRVRESLAAVEQARRQVMLHLCVRDGPPLWSPELRADTPQNLTAQSQNSLARQWTELRSFLARKPELFLIQAFVCFAFSFLLVRAQRKLTILSFTNDALEPSARRFGAPVSTALLLSLAAGPWIYSDAPRLWWSILGGAALLPALIVLRRLLGPSFIGPINVLAWLYLADQLRTVAASQHTLWRFLFLLELAVGLGYVLLILGRGKTYGDEGIRHPRVLRGALRLAAGLLALALVANGVGYERLSSFVGNTTISAAYVGLVLFAVIRAADELLTVLFNIPPFRNLTSVRGHAVLVITNWAFSQRRRLLTVPIAVTSDIEPKRVMDILRRVAGGHPSVAKDGPLQTLLTSLNNGTASYELRAWAEQSENWEQVRSDLLIQVKNSLAAEKISMH